MKLASKVVLKEDAELLKALHKADSKPFARGSDSRTNQEWKDMHSKTNQSPTSQDINNKEKSSETLCSEVKTDIKLTRGKFTTGDMFKNFNYGFEEGRKEGRASQRIDDVKEFKKFLNKIPIDKNYMFVWAKGTILDEVEKELGGTK